MSLLSKIVFLLIFVSLYNPSYAAVAVNNVEFIDCKVFSDEDKKDGDKKEGEEEEPDCE